MAFGSLAITSVDAFRQTSWGCHDDSAKALYVDCMMSVMAEDRQGTRYCCKVYLRKWYALVILEGWHNLSPGYKCNDTVLAVQLVVINKSASCI